MSGSIDSVAAPFYSSMVMATVTIRKSEYEMLKRRASLYEAVLRALPERKWGIERYSPARIREFMREDKMSRNVTARAKKALAKR